MLKKHSIAIRGHRTSFSLEDEFWQALGKIAADQKISVSALVTKIDSERDAETNLSSSLRLYVLKDLQSRQAQA